MFRNYLTIALRNLIRHKLYSVINIAGLAVGLIYGVSGVKSPAPPIVALVGLLGMLGGEQIAAAVKSLASNFY